jgi:excisionase family DNA binding protein
MTERMFLTYREAAELTGLALPTLYSKVHKREIPHYRLGKRLVRFRRDELEQWMMRRRVESR